MNEQDLQKQCNEYLNGLGLPFVHIPNRTFKSRKANSVKRLKSHMDYPVIYLPDGNMLIIELKTESNFTQGQLEMISKLNNLGHNVHCCTSFGSFRRLINKHLIVRGIK